jgi:hypothetical protein
MTSTPSDPLALPSKVARARNDVYHSRMSNMFNEVLCGFGDLQFAHAIISKELNPVNARASIV